MSTETAHATEHDEAHEDHWTDLKYIQLALALAVITAIEVAISYMVDDLGAFFLPLLLGLMLIKFFSVVLFFMHLKFDNRLFSLMFYLGLGLAVAVYVVTLFTSSSSAPDRFRKGAAVAQHLNLMIETPGVLAAELPVDPLAFQWHPEVWLLVGFLTAAYVYMVRAIGPNAVPEGQPVVTRFNTISFALAMVTLFLAAGWPLHDIGEEYLYSAHMVQHMMLSYFLPPLALMATPTWLARILLGNGAGYRAWKFLAMPVIAGVLFNGVVMFIHIPLIVNESVVNGPLHYTIHVLVVSASLLMWTPVCGPVPEFRIGVAGTMIYLFLQSVVPTVPAAWLTFADDVVYQAYDKPLRLWGISAVDDQQLAGAVMKTAGGLFLWGIVIYLFFTKFAARHEESYDFKRRGKMPPAEIVGNEQIALTTADVERAFASSIAPTDDA